MPATVPRPRDGEAEKLVVSETLASPAGSGLEQLFEASERDVHSGIGTKCWIT